MKCHLNSSSSKLRTCLRCTHHADILPPRSQAVQHPYLLPSCPEQGLRRTSDLPTNDPWHQHIRAYVTCDYESSAELSQERQSRPPTSTCLCEDSFFFARTGGFRVPSMSLRCCVSDRSNHHELSLLSNYNNGPRRAFGGTRRVYQCTVIDIAKSGNRSSHNKKTDEDVPTFPIYLQPMETDHPFTLPRSIQDHSKKAYELDRLKRFPDHRSFFNVGSHGNGNT